MFITSFNTAFESTTGWLLYLTCSFLMQYMAVGYSLFHYLLLLLVNTTLSKILLSPELLFITFFSGYSTVYNIHLKDQMSITTETAHHISLQYHYTPYIIPQSFHMVSAGSENWSQLCEYYRCCLKQICYKCLRHYGALWQACNRSACCVWAVKPQKKLIAT